MTGELGLLALVVVLRFKARHFTLLPPWPWMAISLTRSWLRLLYSFCFGLMCFACLALVAWMACGSTTLGRDPYLAYVCCSGLPDGFNSGIHLLPAASSKHLGSSLAFPFVDR